jgi:predicted TIM-barrel fold metal-dependent hydrolase
VQIDAHTHILSLSADRDFTTAYGREGSLCIYRSRGLLPSHRLPTDAEWEEVGFHHDGFPVTGPAESIRDHPGFDKMVILAMSPQLLEGRLIGTVDTDGVTDVAGPPHPEKCNDYIAAVVRSHPGHFIGFGSVNPCYRGVRYALEELERSVVELGLTGVKLYPMYQHWAPNDRELGFPIFEKAAELGITVMVHQAGSTRIDAKMELGRPALLDDIGRELRDLRLIIAHCGIPWVREAMFLLTKHPNFYADLSYHLATVSRRELLAWLSSLGPFFVPLEKLFFGTDYPGFLYDPVALREKLLTVNEEAEASGIEPIPQARLQAIMGDNLAAVLGLDGPDRLDAPDHGDGPGRLVAPD